MYISLDLGERGGIREPGARPFPCLGDERALASREGAADVGIASLSTFTSEGCTEDAISHTKCGYLVLDPCSADCPLHVLSD